MTSLLEVIVDLLIQTWRRICKFLFMCPFVYTALVGIRYVYIIYTITVNLYIKELFWHFRKSL